MQFSSTQFLQVYNSLILLFFIGLQEPLVRARKKSILFGFDFFSLCRYFRALQLQQSATPGDCWYVVLFPERGLTPFF